MMPVNGLIGFRLLDSQINYFLLKSKISHLIDSIEELELRAFVICFMDNVFNVVKIRDIASVTLSSSFLNCLLEIIIVFLTD